MVCQKCGAEFKTKVVIDGKLRNLGTRKYCLECTPFGSHNTKKIHEIGSSTGDQFKCRVCGVEQIYNRQHGDRKGICGSCITTIKKVKTKIRLVEYKGGACVKCGYNQCKDSLEFHHRDPNEKEFGISSNISGSWERLTREADKCDLLCACCHREIHYIERWGKLKEFIE